MSIIKVSVIGLGNMGAPIAGNLAAKGFEVVVFNRSRAKVDTWLQGNKGFAAKSCADCAVAEIVCLSVGNESDVENVIFGPDGLLVGANHALLIVDHTTTSATFSKSVAERLRQSGHLYLDAPVSGGTVGATKGVLTAMCGGTAEAFERASVVLGAYCKSSFYMGSHGCGQFTKMLNQICIVSTLQGVAEAIKLGRTSDIDLSKVLQVMAQGAAQSWQMENRGPWMLDERYKGGGFAVKLIDKDLAICLEQADGAGIDLEVTQLIKKRFEMLRSAGHDEWDFSSLCSL